jgi:hypothetical protein
MDEMNRLTEMWTKANEAWREADMARREIVNDITAEFIRLGQDAIEQNITPPTFVEGPGVEVTYKSKTEYAKALDGPLRAMMEALDPDEIEALLTPVKPAPARTFNMTKVLPYEKRGGVYARAIAAARITHAPQAIARAIE